MVWQFSTETLKLVVPSDRFSIYLRPISTIQTRDERLHRLASIFAASLLKLDVRPALYHLPRIVEAQLHIGGCEHSPTCFARKGTSVGGVEAVEGMEHRETICGAVGSNDEAV